MAVLGIDPGSVDGLGWALLEDNGEWIQSGRIVVPQPKGSRNYADLLFALNRQLWAAEDFCLRNSPPIRLTLVAYEQVVRHSGVYAAHKYGAQIGHIQWWAASICVECVGVAVPTVKRVLRCRAAGKAKQSAMVAAVHKLGYTRVEDHNEADAVGVALGALEWTAGKRES